MVFLYTSSVYFQRVYKQFSSIYVSHINSKQLLMTLIYVLQAISVTIYILSAWLFTQILAQKCHLYQPQTLYIYFYFRYQFFLIFRYLVVFLVSYYTYDGTVFYDIYKYLVVCLVETIQRFDLYGISDMFCDLSYTIHVSEYIKVQYTSFFGIFITSVVKHRIIVLNCQRNAFL